MIKCAATRDEHKRDNRSQDNRSQEVSFSSRHSRGRIASRLVVTIVSAGPYRFTRNQMYLGLMFIYTAGALAIGNVWVAVLIVPVFFALNNGVIAPEERYLQSAFGEQYADYQRRVRRWV